MDNERLAVVEAQLKFLSPIVERTEMKLDRLLESHTLFKGKVIGMCIVISIFISAVIEIARANF